MPSRENRGKPVLLWFKNDLRIHDNEALFNAINSDCNVLCVYVIDTRLYEKEILHFKKASTVRKSFVFQSLLDLRNSLRERGGDLLILQGIPEVLIPELAHKYDVNQIFCEREYAREELDIVASVKSALPAQCELKSYWGKTLYHKDDIPYTIDKIPMTSKAYRINTTKNTKVRDEIDEPTRWRHLTLDNYGLKDDKMLEVIKAYPTYVPGGERYALERLYYYTTGSELLTSYKWTRNKSMGMDHSSKLSPYLALGSISPRKIYSIVKDYELTIKKNISTWWLIFEVVWRDFFTFKGMRMGNKIHQTAGYSKKTREFENNPKYFKAWCEGKTGIPFIDAHMRQLNKTGYMSNRGRVNCASYLVHDLKIDWTWGASYFESMLIDYDVTSNWMNWHNQAYEICYTNPINQSLKYKASSYIKKWIPELSHLNDEMIYIPWCLNVAPVRYPKPIVIYDKWNRAIKKIKDTASN